MTAPHLTRPPAELATTQERVRRGLPIVARGEAADHEPIDVRAWARQLVATALEIEGIEFATTPPETV